MKDFAVRAVEVHSTYAWDFGHIIKTLDFAQRNGLNALIIHRNDAVEQTVFPGVHFGVKKNEAHNIYERYREAYRKIYKYTPTRRSGPLLRRGYLKRVVEEAKRRGIQVYLQNKELSFPDIFLELFPSLIKEGHGCPNEQFWWDFIKIKYQELFEDIPGITGIITSVGTGESRISITSNRCTCDLCRNTTPEQWYRKVIHVMHDTLSRLGKQLILRDFVFTKQAHNELAAAFRSLPTDIIIAIKDTPHDYYPTFPQNTLIKEINDREKWIEYDTMAQYFGWGIGPSTMVNYMKQRMGKAKEQGASGIIMRTDWESLDGHTCFDTPNILNLYAGARFSNNLDTPPENIYRAWLDDIHAFEADADDTTREMATQWVGTLFDQNWEVVRRTLYIQDCVFNDCSTFPVGYQQALWLAEEKNSLKDWVPEKSSALDATEVNITAILEEKDEALQLVTKLRDIAYSSHKGLTKEFSDDLRNRYDVFLLYVQGFRILVRLFAILRLALAYGYTSVSFKETDIKMCFDELVAEAESILVSYDKFWDETSYPSAVYQLINPDRLRSFVSDAKHIFSSLPKIKS